jgi:hypothetical protein
LGWLLREEKSSAAALVIEPDPTIAKWDKSLIAVLSILLLSGNAAVEYLADAEGEEMSLDIRATKGCSSSHATRLLQGRRSCRASDIAAALARRHSAPPWRFLSTLARALRKPGVRPACRQADRFAQAIMNLYGNSPRMCII